MSQTPTTQHDRDREGAGGTEDLLPCPICGAKTNLGVYTWDDIRQWYRVICLEDECGCSGPIRGTREAAIHAWQTRACAASAPDPTLIDQQCEWLRQHVYDLLMENWSDEEATPPAQYAVEMFRKRFT